MARKLLTSGILLALSMHGGGSEDEKSGHSSR